jgi:hypothetical protein
MGARQRLLMKASHSGAISESGGRRRRRHVNTGVAQLLQMLFPIRRPEHMIGALSALETVEHKRKDRLAKSRASGSDDLAALPESMVRKIIAAHSEGHIMKATAASIPCAGSGPATSVRHLETPALTLRISRTSSDYSSRLRHYGRYHSSVKIYVTSHSQQKHSGTPTAIRRRIRRASKRANRG